MIKTNLIKKLTRILIILLISYNLTHSQTKSETIEWLNGILGDYRPIEYDDLFQLFEGRLLEVNNDGTFKVITTRYKNILPEYIKTIVHDTGDFKNIDLGSVQIEKMKNGYYILTVKCFINKECIQQVKYDVPNNDVKNKKLVQFVDKNTTCIAVFDPKDYEGAVSSKKAIEHLIKLLGGKKNPF
jgi:hypothetical protein